MKNERIVASLVVSTLLAFGSGCEKKDKAAMPDTTPAAAAESKPAAVTPEVKETAAAVSTDVKQATQNTTAAATSKTEELKADAQNLIDKAKTQASNKQYQDALSSLKQLSSMTLTPEQQKTVDDLKAQLQKAMSNSVVTNATSALGNLLK